MLTALCSVVGMAAWTVTEAARQWGQDKSEALKRAGVPQYLCADAMGLREPQLSDQLAPRAPMNVYRWADLCAKYPRVELEFMRIRADRAGLCLVDRPEVARLVQAVSVLDRYLRRRVRRHQLAARASR